MLRGRIDELKQGYVDLVSDEFRILEPDALKSPLFDDLEGRNVSTDGSSADEISLGQQLAEARAREAATNEVLAIIRDSREDDRPVFDAILEHATRLCDTPNAILIMGRQGDAVQTLVADKGIVPDVSRYYRNGEVPMDPKDSLAAKAILEGQTVHVHDMGETDAYRAGHKRFLISVDQQGIRTILFVPLVAAEGGIGCLVLWKTRIDPFTDDQVRLIETFAAQAVIAIENVRQFRALEALNADLERRVQEQVSEIERIGRLKRFLSPAVVDAVVTSGNEAMLSSHRALIATLFCDIRGFTAFCETAEPEETIEVLQTYHDEMGTLISAQGGGVDQRMGDGIMVILNDPLPREDPAGDAVRLAIAMRARMAEICRTWERLGYRLGFGVGISLGYATVGMVGSDGRYDYTASGTAVNLAARLCDHAEDGEILLSPRAFAAVEEAYDADSRGQVSLKGIREPVEVFGLRGVAE
jgi:class 3 adenylate cyclase